jgi:hypothetical protein
LSSTTHTTFASGIRVVDEPPHLVGKVDGRAAISDADVPPTSEGLDRREQIAGAVATVLVVDAARSAWLRGLRRSSLGDQLEWPLVEADHRTLWVVRLGVQLEHVLHVGYEARTDLRDAPVLLAGQPGTLDAATRMSDLTIDGDVFQAALRIFWGAETLLAPGQPATWATRPAACLELAGVHPTWRPAPPGLHGRPFSRDRRPCRQPPDSRTALRRDARRAKGETYLPDGSCL